MLSDLEQLHLDYVRAIERVSARPTDAVAFNDLDRARRALSDSVLNVDRSLRYSFFKFDFAVSGDPSAGVVISKQPVPAGALVTGGWFIVTTSFTSANSTATLALALVSAADLHGAVAINASTAPWTIPVGGDSRFKRRDLNPIAAPLTADRTVTITSGVQAITAGALFGAVEWVHPSLLS